MSKLWGGRFAKETSKLTDEFNASITFDKRLYEEDIKGSIAHAKMLGKQKIITPEESSQIVNELKNILKEIKEGKIEFDISNEDIHMNIESLLTERIGNAGKKLHTGRSRNDQVATDFMLFVRKASKEIKIEIERLLTLLLDKAEANLELPMPGYTHLQIAQPITYAHYLLSYYQMFLRDYKRFNQVEKSTSEELPLGSGALAGTTYPLDRKYVAELLDFKGVKLNSLDGVSDRDYAIDFLEACAVTMMHLSRFCEEIIIYNSAEFKFITLDDEFTTGSSIMPQKKNPDLAELIRGKTGRTYGNLISLLTTMKALPLAYNKDMQEDKEPVFDSFDTVKKSLAIFYEMINTLKINEDKLNNSLSKGFINATDMADWLVSNGIPFREAHRIIGEIVLYCDQNNKNLEDLELSELKEFSSVFNDKVYEAISIKNMIDKRNLIGGPSPKINKEIIDFLREDFVNLK